MKKRILSISVLTAVLFYAACTPENPTVFEQTGGVYFNATSDSMVYSFAKYPNRIKDTLWIPVRMLGDAAQSDQPITLERMTTGADTTAKEGLHFKMMDSYTMPAGAFSTLLPVVLYRTSDLDVAPVSFKLELKANEHLTLGISTKTVIKVIVGYLQKPAKWGEVGGGDWAGYTTNFGTWTKTKYKLVLDALYDPVGDSTVSDFPVSRFTPPAVYFGYLQKVKNYILTKYPANYGAPGDSLVDPDRSNVKIKVGPSNY